MMSGFGMRKDLLQFSKPQCSVCKGIFATPRDLFIHFDSFHTNHLSTFSSAVAAAAAPAAFPQYYPNLNPDLNPVFSARNRFDSNYYCRGYLDTQGRFHKGFPPAMTPAKRSNVLFGQQDNKKPRLNDFFPETSPENCDGGRTLPLLYQLEHQIPVETVTDNGGAISSFIDLTLRL